MFLDHFKLDAAAIRADVVIGDNQQGIKTVAGNPQAIGYVSIGTAEYEASRSTPIRVLPLDGVEASTANVAGGRFPLSRPLNLVCLTAASASLLFADAGLWQLRWLPSAGAYGLLAMLVGSVAVSALALVIAVPPGIVLAVWGRFFAPRAVGAFYRGMMGLLARGLADLHTGGRAFGQQRLQFRVALAQMSGDIVVHSQRLPEHEQVLFAPMTGERTHDVLLAGLNEWQCHGKRRSRLNLSNGMRLAPLTNVTDDSRAMLRDGLATRRRLTPRARTNDVSVISALPSPCNA